MSTKTNFETLKKIFDDKSFEVIVEYSGGGDSGDYELFGNVPDYILDTPCKSFIDDKAYNSNVRDTIVSLAVSVVCAEHPGWENNEGGYGNVNFNFKQNLITIEHNEYFMSTKETSTKVHI